MTIPHRLHARLPSLLYHCQQIPAFGRPQCAPWPKHVSGASQRTQCQTSLARGSDDPRRAFRTFLGRKLYNRKLYNHRGLSTFISKERVAVIGSGNWGTTAAKMITTNVSRRPALFESSVRMWVFEEIVKGRKLTELVNETHENPKYLPGISLPTNVVADPDLASAVNGATMLVFVLPHEFLESACITVQSVLEAYPASFRGRVKAVSLIKGLLPSSLHDPTKIELPSEHIRNVLSPPDRRLSVSVLSGANIAAEIAREQPTESTLGFDSASAADVPLWMALLDNGTYFRVSSIDDLKGVELCGALKNVVALAAGFVEGLKMGSNAKATMIRLGLLEMKRFADRYYGGMKSATLLESCGVADMITSCTSGRNFTLAREFTSRRNATFTALQDELLNGQKLQGTSTAAQVYQFLLARGSAADFPLFRTVHGIAFEGWDPQRIWEALTAERAIEGVQLKGT
ncbi:NAD-dependent glycerol-3-phosphate dehydrogenase C-terminus-domain-containing protein [Hyaloraphidium curvatum]|nr:NAD-dependent glycerol-3-phosphate dehydrogenase C-terminus-domain-containing protein [Hyaloraphidium curvatum]